MQAVDYDYFVSLKHFTSQKIENLFKHVPRKLNMYQEKSVYKSFTIKRTCINVA